MSPDTGRLEQQATASAGSAETQGTLKSTQPDGETVQNMVLFGTMRNSENDTDGMGADTGKPCNYRGLKNAGTDYALISFSWFFG